jgi:hypothetical protein
MRIGPFSTSALNLNKEAASYASCPPMKKEFWYGLERWIDNSQSHSGYGREEKLQTKSSTSLITLLAKT